MKPRTPNGPDIIVVILLTVAALAAVPFLPLAVFPLLLVVPAVAYAAVRGMNFEATFSARMLTLRQLLSVVMACVGCTAVVAFLAQIEAPILEAMGYDVKAAEEEVRQMVEKLPLVTIVLGAAVCEEILFRGFLLSGFRRLINTWGGVLVVSVLFALVHGSLARMIPTFALGMAFGWLLVLTRSLLAPVIAHLLNNSIAMALVAAENADADLGPWIWGAAGPGMILAFLGFRMLIRNQVPEETKTSP